MKKISYLLSLFLCFMLGTMGASAQLFVDGDGTNALGTLGTLSDTQYSYTSQQFTPEGGVNKLRFVFLSTTGGKDTSGRHPFVHFAEFYLYDANGKQVALEAGNFSSNATETIEGGIDQLCNGYTTKQEDQGDYAWYWHSTWSSTPNCDHYLEITIPEGTDLSTFSYGFASRNKNCIPTKIMVLAGNDAIAAHDALNAEEQELERNYFPVVYPSDGGRTERAWAAVKAEFINGNTSPEMKELEDAKSDIERTKAIFHTLSINSDLTDASSPIPHKVYDGSKFTTITVPAGTSTVRMTVTGTNTGAQNNGHVYFTLRELTVNLNGSNLNLANTNLSSNADHNALNPDNGYKDGDGLPALYDNDINTFFHSAWNNGPAADHYLQFSLGTTLAEDAIMYISFDSRDNNNVPTTIEFCDADKADALVALNQRIGKMLGNMGSETGEYDENNTRIATDAALEVLRDRNATTEQITAALTTLYEKADEAFHGFADNTQVILGNKNYPQKYAYTDGENLRVSEAKDSYAYLWTLKRTIDHTYKLYNEYTGKYVGPVPNGTGVAFPMVSESEACEFTIKDAVTEGYYIIYDADFSDQTKPCLHAAAGESIVRWEPAADASQFKFITDEDDLTNACTEFCNALINKVTQFGTKYGQYKETSAVQQAIEKLNTINSLENFKALEATIEYVLPETGKIYQIVSRTEANGSRNPGDLLYAEPTAVGADRFNANTDRQMKHAQPTNVHIPNSYWKFEKSESNKLMYLRHLNSGLYAGQLTSGALAQLPVSKDYAGKYSFTYLSNVSTEEGPDVYLLFDEIRKSYFHSLNYSEEVIGYDDAYDDASRWNIVEVTSVPVTIGMVKYATLNLPFAVTIPENVEAYIGKEETNTSIKLEQITGDIPANTPVILVSKEELTEARTYNFAVAYGSNNDAPENKLKGTTTAETIETDATAYILKKGTAGIGLYKVTDRTNPIPANKAYLGATYVSAESAPAMFGFSFGDLTSIKNLETNGQATETYYDLHGRRVLNPAHGVFVKANGEKVFIK